MCHCLQANLSSTFLWRAWQEHRNVKCPHEADACVSPQDDSNGILQTTYVCQQTWQRSGRNAEKLTVLNVALLPSSAAMKSAVALVSHRHKESSSGMAAAVCHAGSHHHSKLSCVHSALVTADVRHALSVCKDAISKPSHAVNDKSRHAVAVDTAREICMLLQHTDGMQIAEAAAKAVA